MYVSTTNEMKVTVSTAYQDDLSWPADHKFVWACKISVENTSKAVVQLMAGNWQVIYSDGSIEDVIGDTIVGEQPILRPGEALKYVSFANLKTSSGIMKGSYKMVSKGKEIEVEIPTFSLDNPYEIITIN